MLSEFTEDELTKDLDSIEHIKLSEIIDSDIEQDIHPAQHRSWLFSIGNMFAKKRKKRIISKGNFFSPTLLIICNLIHSRSYF